MSRKELKRLHLVKKAIAGEVSQVKVAEVLEISDRQIRRLVRRVKEKGDEGIAHGLRGVVSNRRYDEGFKKKVIEIYKKKYKDFGPTLAREKLEELEEIKISSETLRKWLFGDEDIECVWRRKGRKHRQWRERKAHAGEMVQMDGSRHDWFEGRGPECVLMGYVDDASSEVFARFYKYEGTFPAMDSFRKYTREYGVPQSLYADRHTTYCSKDKLSIEEELEGKTKKPTQFERAVGELGVKMIPAYSPQAKGRIERQFRIFQDRVIKEMRLKRISNIEEANKFLEHYLPIYNERFSVKPIETADFHRPLRKGMKLDRIFCVKEGRVLRNDFTVSYEGKLYQVYDKIKAEKVSVEELMDGSISLYSKEKRLKYKRIEYLPKKKIEAVKKTKTVVVDRVGKQWVPSKDHPWRRFRIGYAQY
jgi:hypothetical protein